MFDIDDILCGTDGKNPYGLHDDSKHPLSDEETVHFLNNMDLTDGELYRLNEYIIEDESHTFYDNPWFRYNKNGQPANFIDCLRYENYLIDECLSVNISFVLHTDDESLMVDIESITEFDGYVGCCIVYNDHRFYTYAGLTDSELWICFPYLCKAAALKRIDDIEWNKNLLFQLFDDMKSADVIAQAIVKLKGSIFHSSITNL